MISTGSESSELHESSSDPVPGWTPEVGTRLKELIKRVGGLKSASAIVGVKAEQIAKWRDGRAKPPFYALQQLTEHVGVSLDWIATGRLETMRPLKPKHVVDADLLAEIVAMLEEWLDTHERQMGPPQRGRFIAESYALCIEEADRMKVSAADIVPKVVNRFLRVV